MRTGEIRNVLQDVIDSSKSIFVESQPVYNGQAFIIKNYIPLTKALEIISDQPWNETDFTPVSNIIENNEMKNNMILPADEYNILVSYINAINPKVPLFFMTVDSLTEEQDEKVINIRLPDNIDSFSELTKLNEKLEDTLKLFNIDGEFKFVGFDKGTLWYVIVANGILTYKALICCLKLAQEYFKTKKEYFESEEAKISYEASKTKSNGVSEDSKDFELWKERWLELKIESEVKKVIGKLEFNGHTKDELNTKLIKATTKLIEQLGEGTEFHLSLNPPIYAEEDHGKLIIDYKKIVTTTLKNTEPKQIDSPNSQSEK